MPAKRKPTSAKSNDAGASSTGDAKSSTNSAGSSKSTGARKYGKKDWGAAFGGELRRGRSKNKLAESKEEEPPKAPKAEKKGKKKEATKPEAVPKATKASAKIAAKKKTEAEVNENGSGEASVSNGGNATGDKATSGNSSDDSGPDSPKEEKAPSRNRKGRKSPVDTTTEEPKTKKGRKPEKPTKTLLNKTDSDLSTISLKCTKKNGFGNEANLKIVSWNVGGIRAVQKKEGLAYLFKEDADIICLQEIRASEADIPVEIISAQGYEKFWNDSKSKSGYAGCAIWSKVAPYEVTYGIESPDHDEEGRVITAEYENFYVICTYVPNSGRKLVTLSKRLKWNKEFAKYVGKLDAIKPVIIAGDMNVSHQEIDLANPKSNTKNAGFTIEERNGMTDFLSDGYVDTFRHFYPNATGKYTFWSYMSNARAKNVGWRLDYFITSERFVGNICDNVIRSEVFGSDHCPIVLFLGE